MSTSKSHTSGTVKDTCKMFAPNWWFWGSSNQMVLFKFLLDPPLLPWQQADVIWTQNRPLLSLYHRLRGSASPVLTATHHSYGSPKLSDFFSGSRLEVRPPTDFDAKWLKRREFTQGCAFCS